MFTEKEKAAQGFLYDPNHDEELIAMRRTCAQLCYEYNSLPPDLLEEREDLLRRLLGRTGERLEICQPFRCDYGVNIRLGEDFYANFNCVILDGAPVTFGDRVFIGPNCAFYTAGHPLEAAPRAQGLEYARPITVGNDVWIGGNAVILPGVTIGDGAVIGAGSVVTGHIPSGVMAAGNPCQVIRPIGED